MKWLKGTSWNTARDLWIPIDNVAYMAYGEMASNNGIDLYTEIHLKTGTTPLRLKQPPEILLDNEASIQNKVPLEDK